MPRTKSAGAEPDKLAYSVMEASKLSSVCRATIYREMGSGALASIKVRKRRLITAIALREWLASAPAA